jgi:hypothetical protein
MKLLFLCLLCALRASAFEIRSYTEQMPESNPIACFRIIDGNTVFSMMPPKGWTMSSDANLKRVVVQSGSSAAITIQISTNAMPVNHAAFRKQVLSQFKEASVLGEFAAKSAATPGLGVDIRHTLDGNRPMLTRLCVFKSAGATIEISFVRRPEDDVSLQPAWGQFINMFRVEPPRHVAQTSK